jgi:hypothetical protein
MSAPVFDGEVRGRWYSHEDKIVQRTDITIVEMCYMLNRSYGAVCARRRLLRKHAKPAAQQRDPRTVQHVLQLHGFNPKGQFYRHKIQESAARLLPALSQRLRGTEHGVLVDQLAGKHRLSRDEARQVLDLSHACGIAPMEGEM